MVEAGREGRGHGGRLLRADGRHVGPGHGDVGRGGRGAGLELDRERLVMRWRVDS